MHVLQVEDDSTTAEAIERMLKIKGCTCETTAYGEKAVELATQNDYDIILLDIMLPDIDGYEVLRRLEAARVRTPVLIQSGLVGRDEMEKGVAFGIEDYLVKPFTTSELSGLMKTVIERTSRADPVPDKPHDDEYDRRSRLRDDGTESRRQYTRMRTLKSAQIVYDNSNSVADCLILNISVSGAALQTSVFLAFPSNFVLKTPHGDAFTCEVCWRHGKKLGVRFLDT